MQKKLILALLILSVLFDIKERKIPNKLVLPFILLGLIYSTIFKGGIGLLNSLFGIILVFVIFIIPFIFGGIGGGDIKLLMAIASISDLMFIFKTIIYTVLVGALFAFIIMAKERKLKTFYKNIKQIFFNIIYTNKMYTPLNEENSKEISTIPYSIPIFLGTIITYITI